MYNFLIKHLIKTVYSSNHCNQSELSCKNNKHGGMPDISVKQKKKIIEMDCS